MADTIIQHRHYVLMQQLPDECRDTITSMATAACDVVAVLAPNLGITTRMFAHAMALVALERQADGSEMRSRFGFEAIQSVIAEAQEAKGLPVTVVAPF